MATSIKGLTIKIGADTKELTSQLRSVNKTLNATKGDLKAIQKELNFKPGNTELLQQQQRAYQTAVQSTEEKLDKLKQTQAEMEKAGVTSSQQAQYDALRREILKTESQLRTLRQESILAGNTGTTAWGKAAYGLQQFSNYTGRASASLKSWSDKAGNVSRTLSGISKAAIGAGVAIAGMFLKAGWSRMSAIDDARVKMKAIGMDAKDVQSAMNSASKSVTGTAFALDEAASAAAQASAAGVKQGKEMDLWLQAIADSAAVAGTDFADMSNVFTKVATDGKVTTRVLQQLSKRGLPVYQWLQKEMGVTQDELSKMVSNGEVDLATFRNAVTHNIGGAAQEMGSSTITGAIRNIRAGIARVGEAFLGSSDDADSFAGQIHDVLISVKGSINNLEGGAKNLGKEFGKTFKVIITYLQTGRYYGDSLGSMGKSIAGTFKAVIDVLKTVGKVMASMPQWAKQVTAFTAVLGSPIAKAFSVGLAGMSKFTGGLSTLSASMAKWSAAKAVTAEMGSMSSATATLGGKLATATSFVTANAGALKVLAAACIAAGAATYALTKASQNVGPWGQANRDLESIQQYKAEIDMLTASYRDNRKARQESVASVQNEGKAVDLLINQLLSLDSQQGKTNVQITQEKNLVDQLNRLIPDLNLAYDEQTGKLNMSADALKKKADAYKKEAEAAALQDVITEATTERVNAELKLDEAERKLSADQAELAEFERKYHNQIKNGTLPKELHDHYQSLQAKVKETGGAVKSLNKTIASSDKEVTDAQFKMLAGQNATIGKMVDAAKAAGVNIPNSLKAGILNGKVPVDQAMQAMQAVINAKNNGIMNSGKTTGAGYDEQLQQGLNSKNPAVRAAAEAVAKQANVGAATGKTGFFSTGQALINNMTGGINSKKANPKTAAQSAVNGAKPSVPTRSGGWFTTGQNMIQGIINGENTKGVTIQNASSSLGSRALTAIKKSLGIKSPSRVFRDEVGKMIGEGLAIGITDSTRDVVAAANTQTDALAKAYDDLNVHGELQALEGVANYALNTEQGPSDQVVMAQALLQGLNQIGNMIFQALPKDINLNINGREFVNATWQDFVNEATRRGENFTVTTNQLEGMKA